jgi:trimethylamine--corrinoid protein Co-methyltransferase
VEGEDMTMNNSAASPDRPQFKILSAEKIDKIHAATLEVLAQTGVRIRLPEAVELLADAGCEVAGNEIVKIPARVIEECLDMAPDTIRVYDRNGKAALELGGQNVHFGTGPTIQFVLDPDTGQRRESTMDDIATAARIVDHLPNLDFAMTMGMSGGVTPRNFGLDPLVTDRFDFAAMLQNTTKPLMFSNWSVAGLQDCHRMAVAARGGDRDGLRKKPFIMAYCEPVTPLTHDKEPLEMVLYCAEESIPLLYISGPIAGGTAPVTLAGAMVLSNAELLSGLAIAQLKNKGAPMVYGGSTGPLDMRTSVGIYTGPETWLVHAAVKELAEFYRLPDFNTAGASDSKILDQQAAVDYTAGIMQAMLIGSNLIHDVGYMESGYTACWEAIVLGDEIIDFLKSFLKGIPVNDDTLALDVIHKQGPGGNFIGETHTFDHFRYIWQPRLFDRRNYAEWIKAGAKSLGTKLTEKVRDILANHTPEALDEAVTRQVQDILSSARDRYPVEDSNPREG